MITSTVGCRLFALPGLPGPEVLVSLCLRRDDNLTFSFLSVFFPFLSFHRNILTKSVQNLAKKNTRTEENQRYAPLYAFWLPFILGLAIPQTYTGMSGLSIPLWL